MTTRFTGGHDFTPALMAGILFVNTARLSLDAFPVPGLAFLFAQCSLAAGAGIFLSMQPARLNLNALRVPGLAFSFCSVLAAGMGILFVNASPLIASAHRPRSRLLFVCAGVNTVI